MIDSGSDYFIGSMVIFRDGDAAGLVDGQQRLTTVTMMLAAIRNEFLRLEADDAATGIQTSERKDSRGKQRFVLHTETSYPYLQAAIQSLLELANDCLGSRSGLTPTYAGSCDPSQSHAAAPASEGSDSRCPADSRA